MSTTVTRQTIVDTVKEGLDSSTSKTEIDSIVKATLDAVATALANGNKVSLHGFGTFEAKDRPARTGRNPRTGEPVQIAATKAVAFKASQALKDRVNSQA